MLASHAFGFHERRESRELLLEDPVSENDGEAELSQKLLYTASFDELARNYVQCDTIIWVLISSLLVLAWGIGLIMLLYLPVRRYVLQKDISSRKLYITPNEIVYKATRPSFLPFLGNTKIENHIALNLVIGIIVEQGCLQCMYGLHTFRIQSIAHGKAAPVDELQFQGVTNPELLRKAIIKEAARSVKETGNFSNRRMGSWTEVPTVIRLQSPNRKVTASSRCALLGIGGVSSGDALLNKLEEVKQAVERIEVLVGDRRQH